MTELRTGHQMGARSFSPLGGRCCHAGWNRSGFGENAGRQTKSMGQKHGTKRSRETGEFMDQKKTGKFKSVRREKG